MLVLKLKGKASDIWAAYIYTLKSCYLGFAYPYEDVVSVDGDEAEILAIQTFFYKFKQKILRENCAFTITDLLEDIKYISEKMKLETPVINNTRTLRHRIEEQFGDTIETILWSHHSILC